MVTKLADYHEHRNLVNVKNKQLLLITIAKRILIQSKEKSLNKIEKWRQKSDEN